MSNVLGFTRPIVTGPTVEMDASDLRAAGADQVFVEAEPHGESQTLANCIEALGTGGVLMVTRTARLSLGTTRFVALRASLINRGLHYRSLSEPALSSGASNMNPDDTVLALDNLRRELTSIRTREGMLAASANGRRPGRPVVMTEDMTAMAVELRRLDRSYAHIARVLGVSTSAARRAILDAQGITSR